MFVTTLNDRQTVCTVPLEAYAPVNEAPAFAALEDRAAIGLRAQRAKGRAFFTLLDAGTLGRLYPSDSFKH